MQILRRSGPFSNVAPQITNAIDTLGKSGPIDVAIEVTDLGSNTEIVIGAETTGAADPNDPSALWSPLPLASSDGGTFAPWTVTIDTGPPTPPTAPFRRGVRVQPRERWIRFTVLGTDPDGAYSVIKTRQGARQ